MAVLRLLASSWAGGLAGGARPRSGVFQPARGSRSTLNLADPIYQAFIPLPLAPLGVRGYPRNTLPSPIREEGQGRGGM
ncbi:MAG: hypothetical protein DMG06_22125 [Acidobacteria bacterium]|nr:MAG: hypothetical protein DMG06_22125 [Acidobacteriota bacterium]